MTTWTAWRWDETTPRDVHIDGQWVRIEGGAMDVGIIRPADRMSDEELEELREEEWSSDWVSTIYSSGGVFTWTGESVLSSRWLSTTDDLEEHATGRTYADSDPIIDGLLEREIL